MKPAVPPLVQELAHGPIGRSTWRRLEEDIRRFGRRAAVVTLRPLYTVDRHRLRREVLARPRPHHIAVIMDGNRRWAIREGFPD